MAAVQEAISEIKVECNNLCGSGEMSDNKCCGGDCKCGAETKEILKQLKKIENALNFALETLAGLTNGNRHCYRYMEYIKTK